MSESAATSLEQRLVALELQLRENSVTLTKLEHERDEYKKLYSLLREENERLKRGLLGQKAERLPENDAQLSLAVLGLMLGKDSSTGAPDPAADEPEEQEIPAHTRRKAVRRLPPENMPRVTIDLVPPEVEREGLDAFDCIGTETREVLERRPASCVVVRIVRKKFVRKARPADAPTTVLIAEPPELPIERGLAGPGMLADTIVRRWADHLPLNRLESVYEREGLDMNRSTLCTWHETLAELARPLVLAMRADAFQAPYLCVDATGVLVLAPERCKHGHFWVLVAPEKHVLFEFSLKHDSAAVDKVLKGYSGYVVADAHAVYDHLYSDGNMVEVNCWAHCRRYFVKALASDPERAKAALAPVTALFKIERTIANSPRKKREAIRDKKSRPIVEKFFEWCSREKDEVLDQSPIAEAVGYASNQEAGLRRFLEDGRLPLSNNISELNLRRQAVGRKNWLFVGSEDGALANTVFVSLLASCKLHNIEPWGYLRDLLCLLPSWPKSRVLDLSPAYWKATLEQPETQQKLASNIFRRVVLDSPPA